MPTPNDCYVSESNRRPVRLIADGYRPFPDGRNFSSDARFQVGDSQLTVIGNRMGPSCPRCKNSDFRYRELLSVHPHPGEFSPARITCPSCGAASRVTAKSRLFAVTLILFLVIVPVFLLARAGLDLAKWQIILVVMAILAFYNLAIWPHVVRLKPWTEWRYWLPKSRLIGYTVYLLLPIASIALLIYLAAKLGLGM